MEILRFTRFPQINKKILFLLILILISFTIPVIYSKINQPAKDTSEITLKYQAAKIAFPNLNVDEREKVENLIREQIRLIVGTPVFANSLKVAKKYQPEIIEIANEKKFPQNLALGVALLENGGSENSVSYAGAAGIFQLTENTARILGLEVNDQVDERLDPVKNIEAGITYLDQNLELFSDPGLAVWAHHAGPQNVSRALKIYLQSIGEPDSFDYLEAKKLGKLDRAKYVWRAYVTKDNLNIHKLLSTPAAAPFLKQFSDETELYPYKVVAASIIFESASNHDEEKFAEKAKLFKQGRIWLSELLNSN